MSKRKPSTEPCIYCGSTAPRRSREHVIPQALGTFKNNWTLTCVCHECNQFFSHDLELALAYDSAEAFFRLEKGVRRPADAAKLGHRRMKAWFREPGPFQDIRIEFKPTKDLQVMEPVAVPQISYRRDGEETWVTVPETELTAHTIPRQPGNYEVKIACPEGGLSRLQSKLASLGFNFSITERVVGQRLTEKMSIQVEHEFFIDMTIARAAAKIAFNYAAHVLGADAVRHSAFDSSRKFVRYAEGDMSIVSVRRNPVVVPLAGQTLKGHGCAVGWVSGDTRLIGLACPFNEITYGVVLCTADLGKWVGVNRCHFFDLQERHIIEVPAA